MVIREFSDAGLPISGRGQELTAALVGVVIYAARSGPGDLSNLAEQVKLYRGDDGEWCIDLNRAYSLDDERLGDLVVLIKLKRLIRQIESRTTSTDAESPISHWMR
jgi:hypothetical protein